MIIPRAEITECTTAENFDICHFLGLSGRRIIPRGEITEYTEEEYFDICHCLGFVGGKDHTKRRNYWMYRSRVLWHSSLPRFCQEKGSYQEEKLLNVPWQSTLKFVTLTRKEILSWKAHIFDRARVFFYDSNSMVLHLSLSQIILRSYTKQHTHKRRKEKEKKNKTRNSVSII